MENFKPNDSYSPMTPSYFSPTGMLCFQLAVLAMAPFSALMHIAFILGSWRLCGFGARSAYLVLVSEAFLGLSYTFITTTSSLLGLIGLKWIDCVLVWRILGGIYLATGLSMTFSHSYLLVQRILCIFIPLMLKKILCRSVILICFSFAALYYLAVVALCLSPFAGISYIPEHDLYILLRLPYSAMLYRANQITNYAVMLSSVIAYPLMLLVLKLKLKSSRNSQEEMRLTSQIALSVGVEVIFFTLFELISVEGASEIVLAKVSNLWYYNAITLPYFIMNKRIHDEIKWWLVRHRQVLTVTSAKHLQTAR